MQQTNQHTAFQPPRDLLCHWGQVWGTTTTPADPPTPTVSHEKSRPWQFCWWHFWDGEKVALSKFVGDLQRLGIKKSLWITWTGFFWGGKIVEMILGPGKPINFRRGDHNSTYFWGWKKQWNSETHFLTPFTSSTAQGGGGSFKNRKPIGEIGCCESPMAEQKRWWIELSNCLPDKLTNWLIDWLPNWLND